jgi:hypothetical protein
VKHPKKVLRVTFISDDETAKVLQPSKEPFDFPSSPVSLEPTPVLRLILSVSTVRSDEFDPVEL